MSCAVFVQLNRKYDSRLLLNDTEKCEGSFIAYKGDNCMGAVDVAPLWAPGGDPHILDPYPRLAPYGPTPILKKTDYFKSILTALKCPKLSVRLIRIGPGGGFTLHRDFARSFQHGILRLHIPIQTNKNVQMTINGTNRHWPAGSFWWGDFTQEHEMINRSDQDRTHLVADVAVNRFVLNLFPSAFLKKKLAEETISLYRRPKFLRGPSLNKFVCEFRMPTAFLPLQKPAPSEVTARITLDGKGGLILSGKGIDSLSLAPVSSHRLQIVGAGAGNYIEFSDKKKNHLAFHLKGLMFTHPVTGHSKLTDFTAEIKAVNR